MNFTWWSLATLTPMNLHRLCSRCRQSSLCRTFLKHRSKTRIEHGAGGYSVLVGCQPGEEKSGKPDHTPVMVQEVVDVISPQNGQTIVDMTFGAGGHSQAILHCAPQAKIYALDRDPSAHQRALAWADSHPQITPLMGRFSQIHHLLSSCAVGPGSVDAILFDVGVSSMQFEDPERGFSVSKDGPLDMRMDGERFPDQLTAADVVNHLDEQGLYKILKKYGEEKLARHIAHAIVDSRYAFGRIETTAQLAKIVESVFGEGSFRKDKLMRHSHVATKTFQALRIFVNNELNELHNGLELAHHLLRPQGVCVAVTFHSLEDRIVKRTFHGIDMDAKFNMSIVDWSRSASTDGLCDPSQMKAFLEKKWKPFSKKPLQPTEAEIMTNPRARSAKLRAAYKL